jgi:hypothetical protein
VRMQPVTPLPSFGEIILGLVDNSGLGRTDICECTRTHISFKDYPGGVEYFEVYAGISHRPPPPPPSSLSLSCLSPTPMPDRAALMGLFIWVCLCFFWGGGSFERSTSTQNSSTHSLPPNPSALVDMYRSDHKHVL